MLFKMYSNYRFIFWGFFLVGDLGLNVFLRLFYFYFFFKTKYFWCFAGFVVGEIKRFRESLRCESGGPKREITSQKGF